MKRSPICSRAYTVLDTMDTAGSSYSSNMLLQSLTVDDISCKLFSALGVQHAINPFVFFFALFLSPSFSWLDAFSFETLFLKLKTCLPFSSLVLYPSLIPFCFVSPSNPSSFSQNLYNLLLYPLRFSSKHHLLSYMMSIYHYEPSQALAVAAAILFGIGACAHLFQMIRYKMWFFTAFNIGAISEF